MKTELTDVSDTRKTIRFEIPSDVVDAEINRVAHGYSRQARIPGFRPGKVPASLIKQRVRDQIRHDVMHGLIPKAVESALQERGIDPVDTPDIQDVALNEGEPLTFTAAVETVPSFDPGDLSTISLTRPPTTVSEHAIDAALERLRQRAAKYEPVEGRPAADGDTVVADMERTAGGETDSHVDVEVELGNTINPPGMDEQLIGVEPGENKTFTIRFPEGYPAAELAGTEVEYAVRVKELRRKVLPDLDDEFAKDLGEYDSLDALRERVTADLQASAEEAATRTLRNNLLRQLADRVTFELPAPLVEREIDRRLEEFARQLIDQRIDPRQVGIDWREFRAGQRDAARAAVASALVLDEIARREQIVVESEDIDKEIEEFAGRANRTPAAIRAQIEKEGGIERLSAGLRREKAIDLALSRVKMSDTDDPHQVLGEP
jgi:trigger factor